MKKFLLFVVIVLVTLGISERAYSQAIGIGTTTFNPNTKSLLEIKGPATGVSYGMLIPRMTWANRPTGLTATEDGLIIYSTDGDGTNGIGFYYYDGTAGSWKKMFSGTSTGDYIRNGTSPQNANFNITGTGTFTNTGYSPNRTLTIDVTGSAQMLRTSNDLYIQPAGGLILQPGYNVSNTGNVSIKDGGGSEYVTFVGSSKYVGIGTLSPAKKLEVNGDIYNRGILFQKTSDGQGSGAHGISWYDPSFFTWFDYMAPNGTTNSPSGTATPTDAASGVTTWARRFNIENVAGYGWIFESGANAAGSAPTVKFAISSNTGTFHATGNGLIDGNVGIGNTSPGSALHIGTTSWSANQLHFSSGWAAAGYHATIGSGYSGISAAGIMLGNPHIPWRSAYGAKMRYASDQAASYYWDLGMNGESGGSTDRFDINRNNVNFLTVTNAGSVGIGTTTPSYKLHVPSGYIGTDYINTTDNAITTGVTGIMVKAGDNYHRTANAAAIGAFLGNYGGWIPNNGSGDWQIASSSTGTSYNLATLELRESNFTGNGSATPPRLGFYWGGVVASQIGIESSGRIAILNNPGTSYENFIANNIYAQSNLYFSPANPTISASSYFIAPGGAYFNSGTVYCEAAIQARGGIHDDSHANLTLAGGTSGTTYFSGSVSGMSGYYPSNNMIRLTPNLHLNSNSGNAVILNWDNGTTGNTSTLRIGNGSSADVFQVWAGQGNTGINTSPSANYKLTAYDVDYTAGSSYYQGTSRAVIEGHDLNSQSYEFGIGGWAYNDYPRSGGVIGCQWSASYWGALGYKNSGSTGYGLYYTSAGSGSGFMESGGELTGIGSGGYGGVMGGWSRGEVLGFTTSGELYASYNLGNEYTSGVSADIVTNNIERLPAYSVTSNEVKVYSDGKAKLVNGYCKISFDKSFAGLVTMENLPTITVSAMGECEGIYIASVEKDGFVVKEFHNGQSNVDFTWIAIGKRIDANTVGALPEALKNKDFDKNMKGVMFNENNMEQSATPIWWDGTKLRFDAPPKSNNVKKEEQRGNANQNLNNDPTKLWNDQKRTLTPQQPDPNAPKASDFPASGKNNSVDKNKK